MTLPIFIALKAIGGGVQVSIPDIFGSVIFCSKFNVLSDAIERISRNDPILPKLTFREAG